MVDTYICTFSLQLGQEIRGSAIALRRIAALEELAADMGRSCGGGGGAGWGLKSGEREEQG